MTEKQRRFVEEYLLEPNASAAARKAGYSAKTAASIGEENLRKPEIAKAIQAARQKRSEVIEIDQVRVAIELARIAFADIRGVKRWMDDGCSADSDHLTDELAAAISSLEMKSREIPQKDGPPIVEKQFKVRTWSKTRALHDLADHFGMLKGRGHVGTIEDVMRTLASILLPQTALSRPQSLARGNGTPSAPVEDSTPESSTLV